MSEESPKTIDLSLIGLPAEGTTVKFQQNEPNKEAEKPTLFPPRIIFTDLPKLFDRLTFIEQTGVLKFISNQELLINDHMFFYSQFSINVEASPGQKTSISFQLDLNKKDAGDRILRFGKDEVSFVTQSMQNVNPDIKVIDEELTKVTGLRFTTIDYKDSEHYLVSRPGPIDDFPDTQEMLTQRKEREELLELLMEHMAPSSLNMRHVYKALIPTGQISLPKLGRTLIEKVDWLRRNLPPNDRIRLCSQQVPLYDLNYLDRMSKKWADVATALANSFTLVHSSDEALNKIYQIGNKVVLRSSDMHFTKN